MIKVIQPARHPGHAMHIHMGHAKTLSSVNSIAVLHESPVPPCLHTLVASAC